MELGLSPVCAGQVGMAKNINRYHSIPHEKMKYFTLRLSYRHSVTTFTDKINYRIWKIIYILVNFEKHKKLADNNDSLATSV